jgi:Ni,Fe-hydrogenase III small subunit
LIQTTGDNTQLMDLFDVNKGTCSSCNKETRSSATGICNSCVKLRIQIVNNPYAALDILAKEYPDQLMAKCLKLRQKDE